MDKYIGKKLDGRYEITELIGVGGMAEVYKGIDVIDNKSVAIKILKKEYAENEEFLRRFRNESKAIAVLSHPNIVRIYDVGFSEQLQYIVMEYIEGITLKEYIEEERVLTWKDTIHFVIQILRALQHAHDKGIVHRDIKPQNIMMFNDGTIKVMDFGIAKFAREEGKTATDQAIGSVHYISPEQAGGDVTDQKSDIYSVGAMMYEMLTGKKPFDSDNPVAIAVMHMHDIPERPRAVNPDIPDGLEEIVLKAMEKDPYDRYQNTDEMLADIARFKENPDMVFGYYQEEGSDYDEETRYAGQGVDYSEEAVQNNVYASVNAGGGYSSQAYGNAYDNDDYYDDEDDYDDDDDDDDEEEEGHSSLAVTVLTAVVVVVIIVGVIVIAMLLSDMIKTTSKDRNDWRMPNVVGMDFNDAVNMYGNNIKFEKDGEEYNEAEAGIIIEQDIADGTEFKKGDTLKVVISKGMETVEVPDVTNKNAELVKDILTQVGLVGEIKKSSSTEVEEGYVIKTEPEAGQQAHKGSTVIIYVSMGKDLSQVKVENWVGMTIEDATVVAGYKGLKINTEPMASYEDEGKVVKQSIEPDEKVDIGTEITFYVSNGKKPDGEIPFQIDFPVEANGRFVVAFMFSNEDGTINTQETPTFYCPENSSITQPVIGSGEDVSVTVSITNLSTQKRATIGTYSFNFAEGTAVCTAGGDITAALQQIDGFPKAEEDPTEAPERPTEAPNNYQPGVNGDYDANGNWVYYREGENGDWRNGAWSWYIAGTNGEWGQDGNWRWYNQYVDGDWLNGTWQWYIPYVNGEWGQDGLWYWYTGGQW